MKRWEGGKGAVLHIRKPAHRFPISFFPLLGDKDGKSSKQGNDGLSSF